VRLRQRNYSLEQFAVVEVAPLGKSLARDTASLVVRGLVSFRERWSGSPLKPGPGRIGRPGVIYSVVTELIPSQLHLDRQQMAVLRSGLTDTVPCAARRLAVIANGANGGIWVRSVR
jgi:hypothetical protein